MKAGELAATLDAFNWEILDAIGKLTDERRGAANEVLRLVREVLAADEQAIALAPALKEAPSKAVRLLTGQPQAAVAPPVGTPLATRKLRTIDSWRIVKELFQAQTVDPRLQAHNWIADQLLEMAAPMTPAPAVGGFLDAEVVWPWLLERMIGLSGERPDLAALLLWSASADNIRRLGSLAERDPLRSAGRGLRPPQR